jgi:hypothetical protein
MFLFTNTHYLPWGQDYYLSAPVLVTVGGRRIYILPYIREDIYPPLYPLKGCRRMNKVEKLCTHENGNKPVETIPGMGGRRIKENDGGGEFQYIARTFVNVTMYPQCNNNMIIIF